jgi:hypothetical protein
MPYAIRKLRGVDAYKVYNEISGKIHSKHTTLENAKKQVSLLERLAEKEDPKKKELRVAIENQKTLVKANKTDKEAKEKLKRAKENLKQIFKELKLGTGIIEGEDEKVNLPYETEYNLQVPPFAIATNNKKTGYNYKLVNPITKIRNLAKRKGQFVIGVDRRAIPVPELQQREGGANKPILKDFSPADRALIKGYDELIDKYDDEFRAKDFENIPEIPFSNAERGRPCKLPKNCKKRGRPKAVAKQVKKDVKAPPREGKKKQEDPAEDLFADLVAEEDMEEGDLLPSERKAFEKRQEKEAEKAGVRKRPALQPKEPPTERFKPKGRKSMDYFERMREEGDPQTDFRRTIQVSTELLYNRILGNNIRPLRKDDPIFVRLAKQCRKEKITMEDIQRRFCSTTNNQYYASMSDKYYGNRLGSLVRTTYALGTYGSWKYPWAMRMNYNKLANEKELKGNPIRLLFPSTSNMRLGWGNIGYGDSDEVGSFLDALLDYEFGVRLLYVMNEGIEPSTERNKRIAEAKAKRLAKKRKSSSSAAATADSDDDDDDDDEDETPYDMNMRILSWNEDERPDKVLFTEGAFFRWAVNDFYQTFGKSGQYRRIGNRAYLPYEEVIDLDFDERSGETEADAIKRYVDTWEEDHWNGYFEGELDKEELAKLEPTEENVKKEYERYMPYNLQTPANAYYYIKNTFGLLISEGERDKYGNYPEPKEIGELKDMIFRDKNAGRMTGRYREGNSQADRKLLTNILRWTPDPYYRAFNFAGEDDWDKQSNRDSNRFFTRLRRRSGRGLEEEEETVENIISPNSKMVNPWISFCKNYARDNNMSYRDVITSADAKAMYNSGMKGSGMESVGMEGSGTKKGQMRKTARKAYEGGGMVIGGGFIDYLPASSSSQSQIAVDYNDSELGANGGKRYISL